MSQEQTVAIVGAGVIGLTLALELHARGWRVELWEQGVPGRQASWAAAGMLAAQDPHNPPALAELAAYSAGLYPSLLGRLRDATGLIIPFQTGTTMQTGDDGVAYRLAEHSIDPRQLVQALLAAIDLAGVPIRLSPAGAPVDGDVLVHTTGAWAGHPGVRPRKGQMMRIHMPAQERLTEVYRSEHVYVVPRSAGAQAGTALLGATVEDCGFDTAVHAADLADLRQRAAELVPGFPALADPDACPVVEAWAGLRPSTSDGLPLIGEVEPERHSQRQLIATGHFRNGILLAPATAVVVADLLERRQPRVNLAAFDPVRAAMPVCR